MWRFSTRSQREEVNRLVNKAKFYRELNGRLSQEIIRAQAELANLETNKEPIYSEKEIDPNLQTSESIALGGELRLRAHWTEPDESWED